LSHSLGFCAYYIVFLMLSYLFPYNVQGDQKVSVHLMITVHYNTLQVMLKVSPASLQTFIDTPNCVLEDRVQYRLTLTPSLIPNSNYVITVND
jgi:hypothetical protein